MPHSGQNLSEGLIAFLLHAHDAELEARRHGRRLTGWVIDSIIYVIRVIRVIIIVFFGGDNKHFNQKIGCVLNSLLSSSRIKIWGVKS